MTKALQVAVENLARAIGESEECREYQALKERVMEEETTRALLKEYRKEQTALQMMAMAGQEPGEEAVQRFSRLSGLLYTQQEAAQYLLAEIRLQKLTGEVFQELAKAAGIDLELPG